MTPPFSITGFPLGIDNIHKDTDLPAGAVTDALNVDLDDAGNVLSRPGQTRVASGVFTNLWSHPSLDYALCVKDGSLTRIDMDLTLTSLRTFTGSRICYCLHNNVVYWSSEGEVGAVKNRVAASWGLPVPPTPVVAPATNGGLDAGDYLVAYVHLDGSGMESGASLDSLVTVGDNGAIQLIQVPSETHSVRVYLSPVNGDLLYAALDIPAGTPADWTFGLGAHGKALTTEFMRPPVPGQALASYRGRVYLASGNLVLFSEAGAPDLFHLIEGYFQIPENVTVLAPVEDGLFIGGQSRTWFRQGLDPVGGEGMQLRPASENGVVPGSLHWLPSRAFTDQPIQSALVPAWTDTRGHLCVGRASGIIQLPLANRFRAMRAYSQAAAIFWRNAAEVEQSISVLRYPATG